MAYGVVETTKMLGGHNFSAQSTADVENGAIVALGALVTGERDVYVASAPTATDEVFLVANPAWSYDDSRAVNQNEELYINKAGVAFRVYELKKHAKFKVTDYSVAPIVSTAFAAGQFVTFDGTTTKMKAVADAPATGFYGVIREVEEVGFPYCVGSYGEAVTVGGDSMGYAVDTRVTKLVIEVVQNA